MPAGLCPGTKYIMIRQKLHTQRENVPADTALNFTGTVFDNNETDVDDPKGLVQLS